METVLDRVGQELKYNAANASSGTAIIPFVLISVSITVVPVLVCKKIRKGGGENFSHLKYYSSSEVPI